MSISASSTTSAAARSGPRTRGEGAWLNGEPLGAARPKDEIEILVMEATRTDLVAADAPKVAALAHRLRIMGSTALSLCHLAAGRVDGVCTLKPTRSVDIAAGQLLCRELGLALELFDVDGAVRRRAARPRRAFAARGGGNGRRVQAARTRPVRVARSVRT